MVREGQAEGGGSVASSTGRERQGLGPPQHGSRALHGRPSAPALHSGSPGHRGASCESHARRTLPEPAPAATEHPLAGPAAVAGPTQLPTHEGWLPLGRQDDCWLQGQCGVHPGGPGTRAPGVGHTQASTQSKPEPRPTDTQVRPGGWPAGTAEATGGAGGRGPGTARATEEQWTQSVQWEEGTGRHVPVAQTRCHCAPRPWADTRPKSPGVTLHAEPRPLMLIHGTCRPCWAGGRGQGLGLQGQEGQSQLSPGPGHPHWLQLVLDGSTWRGPDTHRTVPGPRAALTSRGPWLPKHTTRPPGPAHRR